MTNAEFGPKPVETVKEGNALNLFDQSARDNGLSPRRTSRAGRALQGIGAAGMAIGGIGVAVGSVAAATDLQPQAIVSEGFMPSASSTTTLDGLHVTFPEAISIHESLSNPELLNLTASEAARRYGVKEDGYTNLAKNWVRNSSGGIELKPDPKGFIHRIKFDNHTIAEGWLKVDRPGTRIDAMPVVVLDRALPTKNGVHVMDLSGGTLYTFKPSVSQTEIERQYNILVAKVIKDEKTAQPGTGVIPVCTPFEKPGDHAVVSESQLDKFASVAEAMKRYITPGDKDPWINNKANWDINIYGAAHLHADPSGKVHKLMTDDHTVVDAFVYVKKFDKPDATHHNAVGFDLLRTAPNPIVSVELSGGTLWAAKPGHERALYNQVLGQLRTNEAKPENQGGQPDVAVIAACN
jgi:hypothetical protein